MTFADALNAAMDARGLRQTDLCKLTGFKSAQISMLCTGKTKDPTISTAVALAKALDVSLDYLAGNVSDDYLVMTERDKNLLKRYQNMNEAAKSTVDAVVSSMEKDTANRIEKNGQDANGEAAASA